MAEERKLPDGVTHVRGNIYRVPLDAIQFADGGFNRESKELAYHNLRHALADQKMVGRGLSKSEMTDLRTRIQEEGLIHNPILRWHDTGLQVVTGERRIRCLLKLVHDNAKCFDRTTGKTVPAKELYGCIEVEVLDLSDVDAYRYSFSETESVERFGEGARIAAVTYFRSCGLKDKDIIHITGLDPEWLKMADKLGGLGDTLFKALCNDDMSLIVANKLMDKYPDDEQARIDAYEGWKKNAEVRFVEKAKKLAADVEKAAAKAHEAETAAAKVDAEAAELAEALEVEKAALMTDDSASAQAIKAKTSKAKKSTEKAQKRKVVADTKAKHHAAKKPKVTGKDTKEEGEVKPLSVSKVLKYWYEPVCALIKSQGKDAKGEQIEQIDMQDVKLVKLLIDQMQKGQQNILKVLAHHKKKNKS